MHGDGPQIGVQKSKARVDCLVSTCAGDQGNVVRISESAQDLVGDCNIQPDMVVEFDNDVGCSESRDMNWVQEVKFGPFAIADYNCWPLQERLQVPWRTFATNG